MIKELFLRRKLKKERGIRANKHVFRTNPVKVVVFVLFSVEALSLVAALIWGLIASLDTHIDLIVSPLELPKKLHFENYIEAFKILEVTGTPYITMVWNTIWLTSGKTFISMATTIMTAYALGKYHFTGRNVVFTVMIVSMMIPLYGSGAASMIMYHRLGMYDSPLFLLTSASGVGNLTLIIMTFFQTTSAAYGESAMIDGASKLRIFLQIYVPLVLPSLATVTILAFIGGWNDYATSLYYLPSYKTIATGLFIYESTAKFNMNKPVYLAGVMICALPPIILFMIFSDKLMTNVTIGGIK